MNKRNTRKSNGVKGRRSTAWWTYVILPLLFLIPLFFYSLPSPKEINWQQFENRILQQKAVERIDVIDGQRAEIFIRKRFLHDTMFQDIPRPVFGRGVNVGPHYVINIGSVESFERKLEEAEHRFSITDNIPVNYVRKQAWWKAPGSWIIFVFLLFITWNFLLGRWNINKIGGASPFNFGDSTAVLLERKKSKTTFNDVAGLEEAKMEVMEIVDFLKTPQAFTRLGAKIPRGVILVGPPGTGKTLMAKAVAGEADVPFFSISGSEFVEMFVGVGASRVRNLFKKAKESVPCIIFIDEIDAIGRSRGKGAFMNGANDERESTLNQLLTEMDGFGTNSGVIVLAATNRADMLDPALLRPGRFDRHIYLELPNMKEREAIFNVHIKPLLTDNSVDVRFLAAQTPGFSGADIANICNESALFAARKKRDKINKEDFIDALDRIVSGLEKKSKIISQEEKRIIAYHEAGHAVVSWLLKRVDSLVKVSIIPRGKSLGSAWYLPEEKQLRSASFFKEQLCATLGGRASEDIIFGDISSGALDDLEKVTKEAYLMVAYYGFNKKMGNVSYYDSTGQRESAFQKPYSEATGELIDQEIRELVNVAYEETKAILLKNKNCLIQVAELLLVKEILFKEDLENIMGTRSYNQQSVEPVNP